MKIRNKNENQDYKKYLESAINETKRAIDSITYESYPDTNKRTIAELENIINTIRSVQNACIFKP